MNSRELIAIFSPSSRPDQEKLKSAVRVLTKIGLEVSLSPFVFDERDLSEVSDNKRIEDLRWAFFKSPAKILMPSRGGYGIIRILERITTFDFAKVEKVLFGFSDFTFLLNFLSRYRNLRVFHGPMAVQNFSIEEEVNINYFLNAVSSQPYEIKWEGEGYGANNEAMIFGGNLTCFVNLINTPYLPDLKGAVILMEEIYEEPYRVDRMLYYLKNLGIFNLVSGVLIGFSDIGYDVYFNFFKKLRVPFSLGVPAGHGKVNIPIPIGRPVKVSFRDCKINVT